MALPFLPGLNFNCLLGKVDFKKPHILEKIGDTVVEKDRSIRPPYSDIRSGSGSQYKSLPRWAVFDKQVLSFDAFFQETVTEHKEGNYRIRKVKIYFFLEDDTLMVVEPRVRNTGLNQGVLVKRHRAQRPYPCSHLYYTAEDFNLGAEINIYERVYKICDCDSFTASFYKNMGITLKLPISLPPALYEKELVQETSGKKMRSANSDLISSMQFFTRDPYVLRFFCYWDDRDSLHGDIRQLIMHYFLSDDTIELIEYLQKNSGRDKIPWFLRRSKVPKILEPMKRVGEATKISVLNVLGESGWTSRFLNDPQEVGKIYGNFFLDCDIRIGSELNIYNKKVVVYDMDDFTKEYYRTKYGITDFTPAPCPCDIQHSNVSRYDDSLYGLKKNEVHPCKESIQRVEGVGKGSCDPEVINNPPHCSKGSRLVQEIDRYKQRWGHLPPYNGFGSEEDSAGNCLTLHPETLYTKDMIKFLVHDRRALNSSILRFDAKILSNFPPDGERKFILVFYRTDDTFDIHEVKVNNSGFIGGVFCSRKRIARPCQEKFKCDLSEYYGAKDLYLDGIIIYSGHPFKLVGADEYALAYMEEHKWEFPQSDAQLVLKKLMPIVENKEMKAELECCRGVENMPYDVFKSLIRDSQTKVSGNSCLTEHDFLTLARFYRIENVEGKNLECDLNVLRAELKRNGFEDFEDLCYTCKHHDSKNTGKLSAKMMTTVFKAHKLPVVVDRIDAVLQQMVDEDGNVNFCEVISRINWKENNTIPVYYTTPALQRKAKQKERQHKFVNFKCLFEDLVKLIYP